MAHRVADKVTLATIVELSFQGEEPSKIAEDLKLSQRLVLQSLERLEAVMLLVAHDFPTHFLARVLRVAQEEASVYLDSVRHHLGKSERVRDYLEAKKIFEPCVKSETEVSEAKNPSDEAALSSTASEAAQALEVLDFWASRWL